MIFNSLYALLLFASLAFASPDPQAIFNTVIGTPVASPTKSAIISAYTNPVGDSTTYISVRGTTDTGPYIAIDKYVPFKELPLIPSVACIRDTVSFLPKNATLYTPPLNGTNSRVRLLMGPGPSGKLLPSDFLNDALLQVANYLQFTQKYSYEVGLRIVDSKSSALGQESALGNLTLVR